MAIKKLFDLKAGPFSRQYFQLGIAQEQYKADMLRESSDAIPFLEKKIL